MMFKDAYEYLKFVIFIMVVTILGLTIHKCVLQDKLISALAGKVSVIESSIVYPRDRGIIPAEYYLPHDSEPIKAQIGVLKQIDKNLEKISNSMTKIADSLKEIAKKR